MRDVSTKQATVMTAAVVAIVGGVIWLVSLM
jgi:hypothetical protein